MKRYIVKRGNDALEAVCVYGSKSCSFMGVKKKTPSPLFMKANLLSLAHRHPSHPCTLVVVAMRG